MKSFIIYFVGSSLGVTFLIYILMPSNVGLSDFYWLIIALGIMLYIFIPQFRKANIYGDPRINLGLIYFLTMALIIVVGNLSTYIIQFVYPLYDTDLRNVNLYWLGGMLMFSIGYLYYTRFRSHKKLYKKTHYPITISIVTLVFLLAITGTFIAYLSLGFIPFLEGTGTGKRYSVGFSHSIFDRFWSFSVAASALSYVYIRKVRKSLIVYLFLFSAIAFSLFFLIRMYPFLTFLVLFILWFKFEEKKFRLYLVSSLVVALFFVFNYAFVDYRSEASLTKVQTTTELNFIQRQLLYGTFNEFRQLKDAINTYNAEPQYGMTLLALPLGFVPGPLLSVFGIEKDEIMKNNSAALMADFFQSKISGGIRIGILGELFINFRYLGFIFMFFIGIFIAYLQKKMSQSSFNDWRLGFYTIFFGIATYAIIGQINAIGSLLGNYLLLFLLIKILFKNRLIKSKTLPITKTQVI